jgi:hypothetical protein
MERENLPRGGDEENIYMIGRCLAALPLHGFMRGHQTQIKVYVQGSRKIA